MLIYKNNKIVVPTILLNYVVNWHHKYLLNPSKVCSEATIGKQYYCPQLRNDICTHIKVCNNFQKKINRNLNMENYPLRKRRPSHGTDYR